jgi:hypothetical protein
MFSKSQEEKEDCQAQTLKLFQESLWPKMMSAEEWLLLNKLSPT